MGRAVGKDKKRRNEHIVFVRKSLGKCQLGRLKKES
jgi:hypothetical protein